MKEIFQGTCLLLFMVNSICCYQIPPVDFVVYPKGFSISIPDEQGIEIVFFYGNVDNVSCNFQENSIIMSTSKSNGEKWVLENVDVYRAVGQVIYYWLYVKKDGVGYTKQDNLYIVTDITPYNSPNPSLVEPKTIGLQPAEVTTKPRLNLDPYQIKAPLDLATPSIAGKFNAEDLPSFTQEPFPSVKPLISPATEKPVFNLDPYYIKNKNVESSKLPFSQKHPLNLSPIPTKSPEQEDKPILYSDTKPFYINNLSEHDVRVAKNCTPEFRETNKEPLPFPLNYYRDDCKDISERNKPKQISSRFNPNHPNNGPHHKTSEHFSSQTSTGPQKIRPGGDIWFWE